MLADLLCVFAFALCFIAGRRASWQGFVATLAVGYAYGIVRANIESPVSHFIYDGAGVGLYVGLLMRRMSGLEQSKIRELMPWLICLIGWPTLLFFIPIQNPLIQLVGLRGQIFFLPFLLVGALLEREDMVRIAKCLAILNAVELGFAILEVKVGVPTFFPRNAVDEIPLP
jgi:hypothetical protein